MGRAAGALGLVPAAAAKGPGATEGPTTAAVGSAAIVSATEEPAVVGYGPMAWGEGPWRTRGL